MKQYVGEKRGRLEGLDKATGRAQYAGDYHLENMLELALVRSTISHGTIRNIDVSNLPEDVMVFTGKDCAENIVADMLVKQGYNLFYYKNEKSTIEMDFFIRNSSGLIPVEVKASDNATVSLNKLIDSDKYPDVSFGIKLCNRNMGFNGKFYTLPYFLTFLLKRWLREKKD